MASNGETFVAPDGKEVEELAGKEILLSLRRRMPARDFLYRMNREGGMEEEVAPFEGDVKSELKAKYTEIAGSRQALLLAADLSVVRVVSSVEIVPALVRGRQSVTALVIDGIATKQIIQACEEKGVSYIAAKNFAAVETNIELISLWLLWMN